MAEENEPGKGDEGGKEFEPITSQEQLNRIIGERINKVEQRFADYSDLKAKASKFDQAEAANKTELEKAQERIKELETQTATAQRQALVTRIASETGVIPEVITGNTEDEMRAAAQRVIDWRDAGKRTPPPPRKLASGSGSEQPTGEKGRAAAALRELRRG